MEKPTVWYVNVFVSDFEQALAFYRDQLGLTVTVADSDFGYASFVTEGAGFAINAVENDPHGLIARHTGIGWGVANVDTTYQSLCAKGVTFSSPPAQQPWGGYMAMMQDPDSNIFYLDQFREH
jgi:predicted enzyme related to lactoylglutathione lyase